MALDKNYSMIKRTLFFQSPAYLNTKNNQLVVNYPNDQPETKTVPIEDIGFIIMEHPQITISNRLLEKLTLNNAAVINCDAQHMPIGLLMPLTGHTEQNERFRAQLNSSLPLRKNLWQQTIYFKIMNQGKHLKIRGMDNKKMKFWANEVTSGDRLNHESRAAVYYWKRVFKIEGFKRFRGGQPPNSLLNYGYAILRAICARSLVSSGLLPTMGIHHANKYNPYCLADDIMEPYRPYVDMVVAFIVDNYDDLGELTTELKSELLQIPTMDVEIDGKKSPLMVAMSRTTNSLQECFMGLNRKIIYPEFI